MVAIKDIPAEQEITVMYDSAGYYDEERGCEVCEKRDPRNLSPLRAKYKNRQPSCPGSKMGELHA
jgi:hypothetical protein